jgi:hypothetical protein
VTTHDDTTEQQLAELRAQLAAERESRLAWAIEADRLDAENERLRGELAATQPEPPGPLATPLGP